MDGFTRAAEAPAFETRRLAAQFAVMFATPEEHDRTVALVKRGLQDPNRRVRAGAIRAAFEYFSCSHQIKREEFVPIVVQLLFDASKLVRRHAAHALEDWAADVPLDKAARALIGEANQQVRYAKEALLRAVLDVGSGDAGPRIETGNVEDRLGRLREAQESPSSVVRRRVIGGLLKIAMDDQRKSREVLPLVVNMLKRSLEARALAGGQRVACLGLRHSSGGRREGLPGGVARAHPQQIAGSPAEGEGASNVASDGQRRLVQLTWRVPAGGARPVVPGVRGGTPRPGPSLADDSPGPASIRAEESDDLLILLALRPGSGRSPW